MSSGIFIYLLFSLLLLL